MQSEGLTVCEKFLIVWRWICSTQVGCIIVVGCGGMSWTSPFVVVKAVSYYIVALWTSGGVLVVGQNFMHVLKEQDSAVVGVSWPLLSGPASSILNAHFQL